MKPVFITNHARLQMKERGILETEIMETLNSGDISTAKKGRWCYRANFVYQSHWQGKFYRTKQVKAIVAEEDSERVIVTAISLYF